jgi:hypothetical protein
VVSVLEEAPEEEEDVLLLLDSLPVSSSFFPRQNTRVLGVVVMVAPAERDAVFCFSASTTLTLPPKPNHPLPPASLLPEGTFPPAACAVHTK